MKYADVVTRIWRENILFSALVELTYRCNLDCFICYNDTNLRGTPLTAHQYFRFFEELRDLGTLNLTLSGGEPLAHADFFRLGGKARELGFLLRIKTNGHALRGKLAQRMRDEVDPFVVEISLHGARAETHDRQTRVPGSFARLVANLREARALGLRIKLNSPLTLWNEQEIEAMFALADELGVPLEFDPQTTRRDNGDREPQQVSPSRDGVARLDEVHRRRGAARAERQAPPAGDVGQPSPDPVKVVPEKHCGAGSSTITVDPYGNVYPCVSWRRRIGNLHEESIKTLWKHSAELSEIRRVSFEVGRTVNDQGASDIGFCPGLAEQETGSVVQLYPAARLALELRRRRRPDSP